MPGGFEGFIGSGFRMIRALVSGLRESALWMVVCVQDRAAAEAASIVAAAATAGALLQQMYTLTLLWGERSPVSQLGHELRAAVDTVHC